MAACGAEYRTSSRLFGKKKASNISDSDESAATKDQEDNAFAIVSAGLNRGLGAAYSPRCRRQSHGGRALIVSHSNGSGNATGQHIEQTYHGLEEEFERRHLALLRECNKYDERFAFPDMKRQMSFKHVLPGPLVLFWSA